MTTDTTLPDELARVMEEAKAGLAAHRRAELVLPKRKKIWAAMGPIRVTKDNRAIITTGLRRRTALAILTAEHVLPIWERHRKSKDPHRMLEVAPAYMRNEINWDDAWEKQNSFSGGLENANTDEIGGPVASTLVHLTCTPVP